MQTKGCVSYKMKVSQNILFEVRILYFIEKLCSILDKFSFTISQHPKKFEIIDAMTTIGNERGSFSEDIFEL